MPAVLYLTLFLPFVIAAGLWLLHRGTSRMRVAWLAALPPLAGLTLLGWLTPGILAGQVYRGGHAWIPEAGLDFALRMDGLAWMFCLLILGIGVLVVLYAHHYLSAQDSARRFYSYLLAFMGAMLGIVLAGNLLLLVVFWELTSITSFLLIGFWSHRQDARQGARMALTITGLGGLALLGGVLVIGRIVGSYDLDAVLAAGGLIRAHPLYPVALALVLTGVFSKSAQFPLHVWLPHAMAAPTPVSAYLHSATMVKAGIFLLARLHPALAGTELFFYTVSGIGALTLVFGAASALFQHDLKGMLAYSTIAHLGLMTLLFGLSTPLAVAAGLFHIMNHAAFKAALFMSAGIIDHECHTRDLRRLGGLRHWLPLTSVVSIVAALAMAGVPPLNGFVSKELLFEQVLMLEAHPDLRTVLVWAAGVAGGLGIAYSARFVYEAFLGNGPRALADVPHEPPRGMLAPAAVLALVCLVVGLAPGWSIGAVLETAAIGTLGAAAPQLHLALWHGVNTPLMMSLAGIAGGIVLYAGLRRWFNRVALKRRRTGWNLFHFNIDALFRLATRFNQAVANGSLQRSLFWLLMVSLLAAAWPLAGSIAALLAGLPAAQPLPLLGWMLWAVLVVAALGVVAVHSKRLTALVVMGAVGLLVSVLFAYLSAPDLALTQLLVEMVTIALMMMALNYLPKQSKQIRTPVRKFRDVGIALAAGAGVAVLVYLMLARPQETVATEMLARSLPDGFGRNVVNVILVDFRGFDTFGEITVFGIAALVVHAMLRWARLQPDEIMPGPPVSLPMPADLTQLLFPLALTVSIYLFVRGHNAPGGGFIAGLVIAVPVLMKYVLQGARAVEATFGFDYLRGIGIGWLLALVGGAGAWWFGLPFLSSGHVNVELPFVGPLSLASAMVFDLGVYVVVFAGTLLILATMGTVKHRMNDAERATAGVA